MWGTTRSLGTLARLQSICRSILVPQEVSHVQKSGFKVKTYLKLRCKHCYFVRVNGRLHVECHAIARHQAREPFNVKKLW